MWFKGNTFKKLFFSLQIQTLFFKLQSREYFFFIYSPLLRCSSECQDTIFFPYDFAFERNFRYWLKCGFSLNLSYSSSSSSRFLFSFISRCEILIKKKYEKKLQTNWIMPGFATYGSSWSWCKYQIAYQFNFEIP